MNNEAPENGIPHSAFRTPHSTKTAWLEKISKELKNRPLAELDWSPAAGVRVSPFACAEDFLDGQPEPLFFEKPEKNDWLIGEKIEADSAGKANPKALAALAGGAESLDFSFEKMPAGAADFDRVFDGVFLEMISTTFSGRAVAESPAAFLGQFLRLVASKNLDEKALRGALDFDPCEDLGERPDWRFLVDLLAFSIKKLPFFKVLTLRSDRSDAVESLAELLKKANLIVEKLNEKGIAPSASIGSMRLQIEVGPNFFTEISRLRALQILWLNFQKAWAAEPLAEPFVGAHFSPKSYVGDPNQNMIRATEMALAAALGGAAEIFVAPFSSQKTDAPTEAFHHRVARNAQHILKMESFADRVEDPLAGAFFIEKMTAELASAAWAAFQK